MSQLHPQPPSSDALVAIHVCGGCQSQLVQPIDWDRVSPSCWRIELRCPECDWHGTGAFTEEEVAAYDEELERGTDQILSDLSTLAAANFEEHVERFCAALQADLIRPEDF